MSLVELSGADITSLLGRLWWPFLRVGALLWTMPLFGDVLTAVKVRLLLAVALTVLMAPMLPAMPSVDPFSVSAIVLAMEQIMVGALLGLMLQILFGVMTKVGQILSLQMGLAMGVMNDPVNGQGVPLLGQLFLILASFLFFIFDGHLVALDILVESFFTWPPGNSIYQLDLNRILALFGWMFAAALVLAFPAMVAMLTVNMTFGVMNRSAPSLNIFALGFPLAMIMGLFSVTLTVAGVPGRYSEFTAHVLDEMRLLVTEVSP